MKSSLRQKNKGTEAVATPQMRFGRAELLVCVGLVLLVSIVFGRTFNAGFVNYDDGQNVYQNAAVTHGLSPTGIAWAFAHGSPQNWNPVTVISHMLDCQLYGLQPAGHHLTNILLHALSVVICFLAFRRMTGGLWQSAFVAAFFAIHPLRVESVAWISERKDVLSGLFFMLTLWSYAGYARRNDRRSYFLAHFWFVLGLLSKAMLVTVPLILLLLDWWPLRRLEEHPRANLASRAWLLIREKLGFFALSAAALVMGFFAQGGAAQVSVNAPLSSRVGNPIVSLVTYLWQTIWPFKLAVFYPYPIHGLPVWQIICCAALLLAISAVALTCYRKRPQVTVGWLWYLVTLGPVIGIVQLGSQAHADRYQYLAGLGLAMAVALPVAEWASDVKLRRNLLAVSGSVLIVFWSLLTFFQSGYWRSNLSLWQHAVEATKGNSRAHYNYGLALLDAHKPQEAVTQLKTAFAADPSNAEAHNLLGVIYSQFGDLTNAENEYLQALDLHPDFPDAHYNLANALMQQGKAQEAIRHYEVAVSAHPHDLEARCNLGTAYMKTGDLAAAIEQFEKALAENPGLSEAQVNLGRIAWMGATSPDANQRNGTVSLQLSRLLVELTGQKNAVFLATEAAALAETGQFAEAAGVGAKARDAAAQGGNPALAQAIQRQLTAYLSGQPYRESNSAAAAPSQ